MDAKVDLVEISLDQKEMDILTDLIDVAVKHPDLGGLKIFDKAGYIMGKLRDAAMKKRLRDMSMAASTETEDVDE